MPVQIDEITSTVQVDETRGTGSDSGSQGATTPGVYEMRRWLDMARRAERLAERTSAWGFDD